MLKYCESLMSFRKYQDLDDNTLKTIYESAVQDELRVRTMLDKLDTSCTMINKEAVEIIKEHLEKALKAIIEQLGKMQEGTKARERDITTEVQLDKSITESINEEVEDYIILDCNFIKMMERATDLKVSEYKDTLKIIEFCNDTVSACEKANKINA